jgi:hypothetical protein
MVIIPSFFSILNCNVNQLIKNRKKENVLDFGGNFGVDF